MFNKSKTTAGSETTTAQAAPSKPSVVGGDMRIIGDVISDGEVRVEGRLEGDIKCKYVTVSEAAEIRGNVDADELTLRGTLVGSVRARVVRLMATALMMGDVAHEVLKVEAGAKVEGRYRPARYRDEAKVPRPTVKPNGPPKAPKEKLAAKPVKDREKKPEPVLEGSGAPTTLQ